MLSFFKNLITIIKNNKMKRLILSVFTIILASSCAPKPVIVDVKDYKDKYLDCDQLGAAIRSAERFKIAANAEEGFKLGYVFPPTAALGIYRINRAQSAANKRIEYIQRLVDQKECNATEEAEMQIINPQILEYPRKSSYKKDEYKFYQYNGQPQYSPSSYLKSQKTYPTTQYLNPQDYYNQYLSR